ncbi:MAG: enoyl-CoA hydratase/carnithine racemase [Natronomonas sp.]|jgi:enoyl-CoA hydratase/carnithine racemase|uniref:enoyl-CoA hydratase/isomerase family protein n=1 Tax=Natronomonas sp. TaxID=2184060 RepID=UPI003988A279
MTDDVTYEIADAVSTIRLRRPERHNAMTLEMWRAVADGVRRADGDGARAVVLTAEGDLFCSGDDIESLAEIEDDRDARVLADTLADCFDAIERSTVPVVGWANGSAYGGGFELLMAADITVVPTEATFALPETQIGAIPLYAAKRLSSLVGRQRASQLALAGQEISAERAVKWGVFARAVPEADLEDAVAETVAALKQSAPEALATTKAWLNAPLRSEAERVGMRTGLGHLYAGEDAREGAEAFLEGRDPEFVN